MEKGITQTAKHTLMLDGRSRAKLTGVTAVSCFNDISHAFIQAHDISMRNAIYCKTNHLYK